MQKLYYWIFLLIIFSSVDAHVWQNNTGNYVQVIKSKNKDKKKGNNIKPPKQSQVAQLEPIQAIPAGSSGSEEDDKHIVGRLLTAYRLANNENSPLGDSMWQSIFNAHHKAIHKVFIENSAAAAIILRNPAATELFYGIDEIRASTAFNSSTNPVVANQCATACLDSLLLFAKTIGSIRLDNPECQHVPAISWSAESIIERIEQELGVPVHFPNPYPNEYGAWTPRGIVSFRPIQGLYQAWRINQLLKGIKAPRVLEIGAGVGRTAYYARLFGVTDYTIVDIPFTAVLSGYFLARTLGEDQVQLLGEDFEDSQLRIKILTPAAFFSSQESYDLIINSDSLTEMDPQVARAYMRRIETNGAPFLSINHESNSFTIKELVDESTQVSDVERFPYWLRKGYTEEIIRFQPVERTNN